MSLEHHTPATTLPVKMHVKGFSLSLNVSVIRLLPNLAITLLLVGNVHPIFADEWAPLFATSREALAIVTSGHGVGSGFVLGINGKQYLITNEHVLRGGQPFAAKLLDGRKLEFSRLDIAEDRDLIRYELTTTNVKALALSSVPLNIGESISVFGNSDGSGVVTSLSGKLQGVGPQLVELDAAFVKGNSGSPIVNAKGEVVGVATFAVFDAAPRDWVKQGTRFANIRRFGVRVDGAKWKQIDQEQYFLRTDALADIETFCTDFYNLRFTPTFWRSNKGGVVYQYQREKKRYRRFTGLCKLLADAVATFNAARQPEIRANESSKQAAQSRSRHDTVNAQRRFAMDSMLAAAKSQEFYAAFDKIYPDAKRFIQHDAWLSQRLKDDAAFWLEVLKLIADVTED